MGKVASPPIKSRIPRRTPTKEEKRERKNNNKRPLDPVALRAPPSKDRVARLPPTNHPRAGRDLRWKDPPLSGLQKAEIHFLTWEVTRIVFLGSSAPGRGVERDLYETNCS